MKWWVLFGAQGDPRLKPTGRRWRACCAGPGTARAWWVNGMWACGIGGQRSTGRGQADADLTQLLHTTPLDHGFDFARYTSRSRRQDRMLTIAMPPSAIAPTRPLARDTCMVARPWAPPRGQATGDRRRRCLRAPRLGSRHSDHALEFLNAHVGGAQTEAAVFVARPTPIALTPDKAVVVDRLPAARTGGAPMDARHDYIYENDVALGRLIDWLEATPDPRAPAGNSSKHARHFH